MLPETVVTSQPHMAKLLKCDYSEMIYAMNIKYRLNFEKKSIKYLMNKFYIDYMLKL